MRTTEPGKWHKTKSGYWVAKTDSEMSFKMVARTGWGGCYATVQDDGDGVVSSYHSFGEFASVKDAKQWCDVQWDRLYSFKAKARRIESQMAVLQRYLDIARRLEGVE